MLKVPRASLIGIAKSELDAQQAVINGKATYPEKVDAAKALWKGRKSVTFTSVRELLAIICPGAQRCHYCEDSAADEVEHVWPKSLFPEKTFIWSNYVYACGQCNGAYKGDQFAVLTALGQSVELKRPRNAAIVPPVLGFPLFIDPVVDDPLDFLELDVLTGIFVPIAPPGSVNYMRAEYTIGVLGLNDRDFLSSARRNAYGSYLDSVEVYIDRKKSGAPVIELSNRLRELQGRHHPTVWNEIQKLATLPGRIKTLFDQAPELHQI